MATFPQTDVADNAVTVGVNLPGYAAGGLLQRLQVNPRGELRMAPALLPSTELIRQGQSWMIQSDSVVCLAAALPTTAPGHTFSNLQPTGGKHMVLDSVGWVCETSAAAATEFQLVYQLSSAATTATTQGTQDTRNKSSNMLNQVNMVDGDILIGHGGTITNQNWSPLGPNFVTALTATVGFGIWIPLNGSVVVAPQRQINFDVVAANATAAGSMMYIYHKVQLQ